MLIANEEVRSPVPLFTMKKEGPDRVNPAPLRNYVMC